MKMKGFTLAEVLITLGIIGVVAALTAPALIQDVSNAHIGPTLSKFKSTLENANYQMLNDAGSNDLQELFNDGGIMTEGQWGQTDGDGNFLDNPAVISGKTYTRTSSDEAYLQALARYIQGSNYIGRGKGTELSPAHSQFRQDTMRAGTVWGANYRKLELMHNCVMLITAMNNGKHTYRTGDSNLKGYLADIIVDINGRTHGPNKRGIDLFDFTIDRSGAVLPTGGDVFANGNPRGESWRNSSSNYHCDRNGVGGGWGCAGSIFDNNLKVIYK